GIEPGAVESAGPVAGEIGGHHDAVARGIESAVAHHLLLELEHLGQVELEPLHSCRKSEPERPGVQSGAEHHDLTATAGARVRDDVVEERVRTRIQTIS